MVLNNSREKRSECDHLIVFDNLGFGISNKSFQKINDRKSMMKRCEECEQTKDCSKKSLFALLMADTEVDKQTKGFNTMN